MVWGDKPIDTTATQQLPQVDRTMLFPLVGDEDLADASPTRTLADEPPAKRLGAHRKPPRELLTLSQTGAVAAVIGAVAFVGFLASESPGPEAVRQAAPDASVATTSPSPRPTVKRPVVRPAEPVSRRQERPALPVRPSRPKPTASPTPDPTSPAPVETADPDEDPTPATEATDDND